jgi:hypothetical protein
MFRHYYPNQIKFCLNVFAQTCTNTMFIDFKIVKTFVQDLIENEFHLIYKVLNNYLS